MSENEKSHEIWERSKKVFPGGVNSPVRAYQSVGREPIAIRSGKGAYITDEDGNNYLDFVNSWGPLILGHSDPDVVVSITKQAALGTSFGAVTKYECDLGELIINNIPHVESVRFVNSGTEAVMSALRLARGYTERDKIIKFEGCYHGHHDSMLVKAGSGLLTFSDDISESSSPGIPQSFSDNTIVLPLDDNDALTKAFATLGNEIAAVIIEPLPANSGLLIQRKEFLQKIQELTAKHGSLFIMDEVINGFRLGFSGFAGKYGFIPDLVTYGKIIGGGLPVGAFGGKKEIMKHLSPEGKVYQAGTLSGNPLAMAAGTTVLKKLLNEDIYTKLNRLSNELGEKFDSRVKPALVGKSFSIDLVREESIFWLNIHANGNENEIRQVTQIWDKAPEIYAQIFRYMLQEGVHIAPSAYEVGFLSYAMESKDILTYIETLIEVIGTID
ncbi:MAG: glutamate-1-semialdehyde 2,1-aminomutase [Leptospirales bacterium]